MNRIFETIGTSKQSFHQMVRRKGLVAQETGQLLYLVGKIRADHPRMSIREIYFKLQPCFIGRDRFEKLCLQNGYGVSPHKNFRRTTDSRGVTRFANLIKQIEVTGVNQVFVSDITYFEMDQKFYYITLIMDLYNRELAGFHAADSLRTEQTTLPALERLIRERGKANIKGAIIHSDGGGQYYCKEFLKLTMHLEMLNSMTGESVYENAHAERLNRTIKNNYLYPYQPKSLADLRRKLDKAVTMYNTDKAHRALGGKTPVQYRTNSVIDNEDNTSCYLPLSTTKHHQHQQQNKSNSVNVI